MSQLLVLVFCLFIGICNCKNIFVIDSFPEASESDLVSVVVLYRHGDRSPIASFPTDPYYNSSYWPEGYGQLLSKGVQRQYNLGKWLRTRYSNFLQDEYSVDDITVYSTDVDRTLMSAEANLAGLYPPPDSQKWDDDLLWEPIPVHSRPTNDAVLTMNSPCKKHSELEGNLEDSEAFQEIYKNYSELFDQLSNYTGMNITTISDAALVYDVWYVYQNHNESYLPSWTADVDFSQVQYLAAVNLAKSTYTTELRQLRAGPFYYYLINYFSNLIGNPKFSAKFLMLSAHDSTLTTILNGMNAFDNRPPEFGSTVIWELRKSGDDYYVNTFYKANETDILQEIQVFGCDINCSFENFKSNLSSVCIVEIAWENKCNGSFRVVVSWILLLVIVGFHKLV